MAGKSKSGAQKSSISAGEFTSSFLTYKKINRLQFLIQIAIFPVNCDCKNAVQHNL
jgi:hypothetical protein